MKPNVPQHFPPCVFVNLSARSPALSRDLTLSAQLFISFLLLPVIDSSMLGFVSLGEQTLKIPSDLRSPSDKYHLPEVDTKN